MSNNNIGKEVPSSTTPNYNPNLQHPLAYPQLPQAHMPSSGPGMHQAPTSNGDHAGQRYAPATTLAQQTTPMMPSYSSAPTHGMPYLSNIHSNATGGSAPPFGRYPGGAGVPPQYGSPEIPSMPNIPLEMDHVRPGIQPIPSAGPVQNGGVPNQALIQMLSGGFTKASSGSVPGMDGNLMMPTRDQLLIQGPIVLNQLNSVAEFLAAKGDFPNAIKYYEQITTMDSENGAAWTALGHCYLLTDDLQKAFTSYQKALYSLPDVRDPQLWYGIGLLYDKVFFCGYTCNSLRLMNMLFPL